ncbi:AAA family ATPase [Bacillus sp. CGMCC 1.16541]|uniref:AAA family ATPase n=1 Tax=Bacillus sp. CGMCC 1.16541 TaxID=2185143 RepID=UPI000D72AF9D|nr:AAA family ATPase [Bacillus sp. CGMCC 1.16541]
MSEQLHENQLRQALKEHIETSEQSQSSIAKAIGISAPALSQFMNSTYATPHKLLPKIEAYLSVHKKRQIAPKKPDFVPTSISTTVINVITYCHIQGTIGVIYGDAGVGKTQGAREYCRNQPEALFITISPAYSGPKGVSELIAEELRVPEARSIRRMHRDIVKKLEGSGRVIIIDEAQHLTHRALEHLRSISDESGVGLVLIGNQEVYTKMLGRGEAAFAQLFSRMAMKENVLTNNIKQADMDLLFPLLSKEEKQFLLRIARSRWGIRGAVNVFVNSASNQDTTVTGLASVAKYMGIGA